MSSSGISFTGLASGMDTDALVSAMLTSYEDKYKTAQKEQALLELKLDKYKEVNNKVVDFYDNSLRAMRLESTFTQTNTSVSNPNIVEIISGGQDNDYIEVQQTAKPGQVATSSIMSVVTTSTTLEDLGIEETGKTITIHNVTDSTGAAVPSVTIDLDPDKTVDDLITELNDIQEIDADYNYKTGAFSINFSGSLTLSGDLGLLGINVTEAEYSDDNKYTYYDDIKTTILQKDNIVSTDTNLGTLGIGPGTLYVNGHTLTYQSYTTVDEMLDMFKSAGVDVDFVLESSETSGNFVFTVDSGFKISGTDVGKFLDISDMDDNYDGNYTFDTTLDTEALQKMDMTTDENITAIYNLPLSSFEGINSTDTFGFTNAAPLTGSSTIGDMLLALESSTGTSVAFDPDSMSFVVPEGTQILISSGYINNFEKLGLSYGGTIAGTSLEFSTSAPLSVFGIDSGSITIINNNVDPALNSTLPFASTDTIQDVLNYFDGISGISASFDSSTNTFNFDTSSTAAGTIIQGNLDKFGITTGNSIYLGATAQSEDLDVSSGADLSMSTTLKELGYDLTQGLTINGQSLSIDSTTTLQELDTFLQSIEGVDITIENTSNTYKLSFDLEGDVTIKGDLDALGINTNHNAIYNADGSYTFTDEVSVEALERTVPADLSATTLLSELGITVDPSTNSPRELIVNGTPVALDPDMSIGDLLKSLEEAGVTARFDSKIGAFQITKPGGTIEFTGDTSELYKLGINPNEDGEYLYEGQQAKAVYNGMVVYSDTNVFELEGIVFAVKSVGEAFVSKTPDVDKIYDSIMTFVDSYNVLIEELNELVNAAYNKDYLPLLDEEMAEMSDHEIELWNAKIDASLLRRDSTLQSLLTKLRYSLSDYYPGQSPSCLMEIGITTSSNYQENGKLYVDEDKLRDSLTNNLEGVMDLFTGNEEKGMTGLAEECYGNITDMLKRTAGASSSMQIFNDLSLETAITNQKNEVDKALDRMEAREAILKAKFLSMEMMVQQLNSQASMFSTSTSA
ncbi:MAG: hypothetical protein BEN18_03585 [Epulopiscium sp. Nuni2H_MBin001]|nr:MAG: hypothetical protein BEN18_03585 [Epulopiscium sp. Nuni2H_MBin001]